MSPPRFLLPLLLCLCIGGLVAVLTTVSENPKSDLSAKAQRSGYSSTRNDDSSRPPSSSARRRGESGETAGEIAQPATTSSHPEWDYSRPPFDAPLIPPGVSISPVEMAIVVDGKRFMPTFQGSFSERMNISARGSAALIIDWPAEHKAEAILASTANDGTVNGGPGAILKRGADGRFRLTFQAGPHSGATQVILRAANLEYTVNFWVPTGNPNVDPPALQ